VQRELGARAGQIQAGQVIEWDSLHDTTTKEAGDKSESDAEMGEDEQSEDEEEDEEGDAPKKGDEENNSVIAIYF
jgi:hypothetical protein